MESDIWSATNLAWIRFADTRYVLVWVAGSAGAGLRSNLKTFSTPALVRTDILATLSNGFIRADSRISCFFPGILLSTAARLAWDRRVSADMSGPRPDILSLVEVNQANI